MCSRKRKEYTERKTWTWDTGKWLKQAHTEFIGLQKMLLRAGRKSGFWLHWCAVHISFPIPHGSLGLGFPSIHPCLPRAKGLPACGSLGFKIRTVAGKPGQLVLPLGTVASACAPSCLCSPFLTHTPCSANCSSLSKPQLKSGDGEMQPGRGDSLLSGTRTII